MLRLTLWALQGFVAVLLASAIAARYIHPREAWGLQLVAVGMPLLIGLGLAFAVAHAWARQPLGIAFWLLLLTGLAPRYVGWPEMRRTGDTLTLITFNVDDSYLGRQDRRPVEGVLKQYRPDLVALQEASLIWYEGEGGRGGVLGPGYLMPLLASANLELPSPDPSGRRTRQRLPLFTSLRWIEHEELDLWGGEERGRRSTGSRSVMLWEGRPFAVYNIHLRSFGPDRPWRQGQRRDLFSLTAWSETLGSYRRDFMDRAADAELLRQRLDAETLPYILCGDLNSTPHHWVHGHLSRGGLRDAFQWGGRGWGGTYHDRLPLVRIDHVLVSSHWRVHRAEVISDVSSDHRPVVAILSWARGRMSTTPPIGS